MAQPDRIYAVVLGGALGGDPPLRVFTVKDELREWLTTIDYADRLEFWRLGNGTGERSRMTRQEIVRQERRAGRTHRRRSRS